MSFHPRHQPFLNFLTPIFSVLTDFLRHQKLLSFHAVVSRLVELYDVLLRESPYQPVVFYIILILLFIVIYEVFFGDVYPFEQLWELVSLLIVKVVFEKRQVLVDSLDELLHIGPFTIQPI